MTNELTAYAGAVFLVAAFAWLVFVFQAPAHLKRVLAVSQAAAAILRDPAATDHDKEKTAQRCSVQLFGLFLLIMLSFVGALVAPAAVLWLLDFAHLISLHAVIAVTTSISFLVTSTVIGSAAGVLWPRLAALRAIRRK